MISQFKEICLKMKANGHSDKVLQVLGSQFHQGIAHSPTAVFVAIYVHLSILTATEGGSRGGGGG